MDIAILSRLNMLREKRKPAIIITRLTDGFQQLIERVEEAGEFAEECARRLRSGKSGLVIATDETEFFFGVYLPSPRLYIIGAVHISQILAPMARSAGLDVTVIDPRTAFASQTRFDGEMLHSQWPSDIMEEMALDPFSAMAALTHDPKIDDWPLVHALKKGCFYVGALGSRKTHAKRIERLCKIGVKDAEAVRIHAPIGLDIGAQSPAEIAVAILAEIISTLRKAPNGSIS